MRDYLKRIIDLVDEADLADLLWIMQQYLRRHRDQGAAD